MASYFFDLNLFDVKRLYFISFIIFFSTFCASGNDKIMHLPLLSISHLNEKNDLTSAPSMEHLDGNGNKINMPACQILELKAESQTACVQANNTYNQNITVTYSEKPASGKLNVNGRLFDITQSPQTVTLIGLQADGNYVKVTTFFTDAPACTLTKDSLFKAPVHCCPVPLELGNDLVVCEGNGTIKLEAGTNTDIKYKWIQDGQILPSIGGVLFVTISGLYGVEVTHTSGCTRYDSVRVNFQAAPIVQMLPTQSFCKNEKYTITAQVSGATDMQWYKNNVLIPGAKANSLEVTDEGTYRLEVSNRFGCVVSAQTTVTTIAAPTVDLGNDQKRCDGESATLNAGTGGTKYEWFKDDALIEGAVSATYNAKVSGSYRVLVTNASQCRTEDQIKLDFFAKPAIKKFPVDTSICIGKSITLKAEVTNYSGLQWFYEGNRIPGSTELTLTVSNSGKYTIEAINPAGCKSSENITVKSKSIPFVELGNDIVACTGSTLSLFAGTEGTRYQWQKDGSALSESTNSLPVRESGNYQVTVTNQLNCAFIDGVKVTFLNGPNAALNGDTTICEGQNHVIKLTTDAVNPEIRWYKDGDFIIEQATPSLTVNLAGTYEVVVKGGSPSCETRKSVVVQVNPGPAVNLGNDYNLCIGDPFPTLNGGPNNSFVWSYNGQKIGTSQTIVTDKAGIYTLQVTNSFKCERTVQVRVNVTPFPTLQLEDSYVLCDGEKLTVTAQSNANRFEWRKDNNLIPLVLTNTLVINQPGKYLCRAYNFANCRTEKAFEVIGRPKPAVNIGLDTTLCPNTSYTFNAGTQHAYLWSDDSKLSSLTINTGSPSQLTYRLYAVTVTNEYGCVAADTVEVKIYPAVKATVVADKSGLCKNEVAKLTASGGLKYKWTDPNGNTLSSLDQPTTTANPTKTTTYTVEVSDGICVNNKEVKSIEIKVFTDAKVTAGRDTCIISGRTLNLKASGGATYQWDNADLILGPSDVAEPIVRPVNDTKFVVTIVDTNGCAYVDSVNVCVNSGEVATINIITPNNDGKNDELIFDGLESYPDNTLHIYNRWGNLVYEAKGYQINGTLFNGEKNGERLPPDTYYYVLKFDDKMIKSALTILWD